MGSCRSDFLFAVPSWKEGVARLVDFGGLFDAYTESDSEEAADTLAMAMDWASVGDDLLASFRAASEDLANHNRPGVDHR